MGGQGVFAPANVSIWELEFGRGARTLRGLSGQVSKICFSADGSEIAALSHNWEVGVWRLATGELVRILEVPKGAWADNAALALSPDGERLAFSALQTARVWNLQSGTELASWNLPPGFVDVLGFPDRRNALLFRVETLDGKLGPFNNADPREYPRVCRIRNLLTPDTNTPIAEIRDFNYHVFNAAATTDGRRFVVEGLHMTNRESPLQLRFKCFNAMTGEDLWTVPSTRGRASGGISVDPTGKLLVFQPTDSLDSVLVEMSSGMINKSLPWQPSALSPGGSLYVVAGSPAYHDRGYSLFSHTGGKALITLGIDTATSNFVQFDHDGTRLAWGNTDGTVTVCNLHVIHARLTNVSLQW